MDKSKLDWLFERLKRIFRKLSLDFLKLDKELKIWQAENNNLEKMINSAQQKIDKLSN